jgi:hypothetical protein
MKVLTGVAALLLVAVLVAAGGGRHRIGPPLRQRLVRVARRLAHEMTGYRPARTVRVYGPASYKAALAAWDGGATTPNGRKGRYYVIVVRGHFVATGFAASPSGSVASRLWSPTSGSSGTAFSNKLPASISRLGHPTLIQLG